METYFATIKSNKGYADIVTSIKVEEGTPEPEMQKKALNAVVKKRSWTKDDFTKYGYTTIKFSKLGDDNAEFCMDMWETEHQVAVIMRNGLPIAEAPSERQARKVVQQMKADKDNEPGIYKVYMVNKWVNEKKATNGYYKLKGFKEEKNNG